MGCAEAWAQHSRAENEGKRALKPCLARVRPWLLAVFELSTVDRALCLRFPMTVGGQPRAKKFFSFAECKESSCSRLWQPLRELPIPEDL